MNDVDSDASEQPQPSTSGRGLPVYVMLPLDTVWLVERDGKQVCNTVDSIASLLQANVGGASHQRAHRRALL